MVVNIIPSVAELRIEITFTQMFLPPFSFSPPRAQPRMIEELVAHARAKPATEMFVQMRDARNVSQ